jgi:hypothetical protein
MSLFVVANVRARLQTMDKDVSRSNMVLERNGSGLGRINDDVAVQKHLILSSGQHPVSAHFFLPFDGVRYGWNRVFPSQPFQDSRQPATCRLMCAQGRVWMGKHRYQNRNSGRRNRRRFFLPIQHVAEQARFVCCNHSYLHANDAILAPPMEDGKKKIAPACKRGIGVKSQFAIPLKKSLIPIFEGIETPYSH